MDSHPLVIADASGVIRHWSSGAALAFGHSTAIALGQTLDLIVPPEFQAAHWKGFRRAVETGHAEVDGAEQSFPVRSADGSIAMHSGVVTLLRNSQRRVLGVMVIFEPHPQD